MKNYSDFGIQIPYGRHSGQVKTICPRCHERRTNKTDRSLSVNLDEGIWNCHYCEWTGTLKEASDYQDNISYWRDRMPLANKKTDYKKPKPAPITKLSEKVVAWFASRGITEGTLLKMMVTEGTEMMPRNTTGQWQEMNTVQFNYYREGELVNVKYRTGEKGFKMVTGAELLPYNIDSIKGQKSCIITEGEMDTLSFVQAGFEAVISVPNGANKNLTWLDDYLESYFDELEEINIAVDTDDNGIILRDELVRRLGAYRCRIVTYGEGCKDGNEHLMKFGVQSLRDCIKKAREVKIEGVFYLSDYEDNLDLLYKEGDRKGLGIGHPNFDSIITFETKRLCVVTGVPSSGKSEFVDEMVERLNILHGMKVAYYSPENFPIEYHGRKIIEKLTGKHFGEPWLKQGEYEEAKEYVQDNFFHIYPKEDATLTTILGAGDYLVNRKGIKILVIDPFNRVESEKEDTNETETNYISRFLDRLTYFAQRNDVLVILVAHPNKQPRKKGGDGSERPRLYDISGSAHFRNKADFGIIVDRNYQDDLVDVVVEKVKFKHLGESGKECQFKYNKSNGRYVQYEVGSDMWYDANNHIREGIEKGDKSYVGVSDEGDSEEHTTIDFRKLFGQEDLPF